MKSNMTRIDLSSKKAKLAIRFFTYGFMTFATIIISSLFLFFALGYRFDNDKRTFEQGGLLQFRSFPENGLVTLDKMPLSDRTPGKASVASGSHNVLVQLNGFVPWQKDIKVSAGQVLWLNYIRFVPNKITTKPLASYPAIYNSLATPNRRLIAIQPSISEPRFVIADIRNELKPEYKELVLNAGSYTSQLDKPDNFEMVEWDLGSRYMLIRHTSGDLNEILRIDIEQPGLAVNLTAKFGAISQAQFAGNNGNIVYGLINNELRRLEVNAETLASGSDIIAADINYFIIYKSDSIGFIASRDGKQEVGVIKNDREVLAGSYPLDTKINIALNSYFNHDYLAVSSGNGVEIIRDPSETINRTAKIFSRFGTTSPSIDWLYFSNNGRVIVAQSQSSITSYDLELADTHTRDFGSSQPVTERYRWLDDYYLIVSTTDKLRIAEFDGSNEREITTSLQGQTVTLSENGEALFSFGSNSKTKLPELQNSKMIL